eukprot:jgi/Mesvir1/7560/Mv19301-RA.1
MAGVVRPDTADAHTVSRSEVSGGTEGDGEVIDSMGSTELRTAATVSQRVNASDGASAEKRGEKDWSARPPQPGGAGQLASIKTIRNLSADAVNAPQSPSGKSPRPDLRSIRKRSREKLVDVKETERVAMVPHPLLAMSERATSEGDAEPPEIPTPSSTGSDGSAVDFEFDAPTPEEIEQYAVYLGMKPTVDGELLWIAEQAILAPPPEPWVEQVDHIGRSFFFNRESGAASWEHPLDEDYRRFFAVMKESLAQATVTVEEVEEMAEYLGIRLSSPMELPLLWVARQSVLAPLPPGWLEMADLDGAYYYHEATGEVGRQHPLDDVFRQLVHLERGKMEKRKQEHKGEVKPPDAVWMRLYDQEADALFDYNWVTREKFFATAHEGSDTSSDATSTIARSSTNNTVTSVRTSATAPDESPGLRDDAVELTMVEGVASVEDPHKRRPLSRRSSGINSGSGRKAHATGGGLAAPGDRVVGDPDSAHCADGFMMGFIHSMFDGLFRKRPEA